MLYDTVENLIVNNEAPPITPTSAPKSSACSLSRLPSPKRVRQHAARTKLKLHEAAVQGLDRKSDRIREVACPFFSGWAETTDYDDGLLVPITDGKRVFNIVATSALQWQSNAAQSSGMAQGAHARNYRRTLERAPPRARPAAPGVQNAAYEQKDPSLSTR